MSNLYRNRKAASLRYDDLMRKAPKTGETLTELGRVRLSKSFFMRDMLHSEIAQVHGLLNAPDDPGLAVAAGPRLCEE
mgnify:CR=1 FL=1